MLTILCPTIRCGGLDVLTDSLRRQTNQDFELLILDAIHAYRSPLIADKLAALPFPVRHLASEGIALSNYCAALNHGIVEARGETVLIIPDFAWLDDDCIETHAEFHERFRGDRKCLMADYCSRFPPPFHPSFPGYHPKRQDPSVEFHKDDPAARYEACVTAEAERYEADLRAGKLDDVMWSLFAAPLTREAMLELPIEFTHTKFGVEWGPLFCSLKNESFPVEAMLELNGLDEDLDGNHLYQDWSTTKRLTEAGWDWARVGNAGKLHIINPRGSFNAKRILRPMRDNEAEAERKRLANAPVNPGWSLRERREAARG